jgi:hypothetical protein
MTIKQLGGVFGRNPTFNNVTIEGTLTFDGDIDINSDLTIGGNLDVTGNVGIGTSTITSGFKMEVTGDARFGDAVGDDAVELGWSSGGAEGFIQAYDRGASAFRPLNINNAMTLDASGNVGIGTSSPASLLHIFDGGSSVNNTITFGNPASTPNAVINYTAGGSEFLNISCQGTTSGFGNIVFKTGATPDERLRIDASGNLLVGTTSGTGYKVRIVASGSDKNLLMVTPNGGTSSIIANTSGTADYYPFLFTTEGGNTQVGSIVAGASSTAYNTSSDQRLKENIADADDAGSKVDAI